MSGDAQTLSRGPRKWLSAPQKLKIVEERFEVGQTIAEVARKHNVGVSSLIKWRKQAQIGSLMGVKNNDELVPVWKLLDYLELHKNKDRFNT